MVSKQKQITQPERFYKMKTWNLINYVINHVFKPIRVDDLFLFQSAEKYGWHKAVLIRTCIWFQIYGF